MFQSMHALKENKDNRSLNSRDALTSMVERALEDSLGHQGQLSDQTQKTISSHGEGKVRSSDLFEDFGSETYEDILATAVLNKVLEKCDNSPQELSGDCILDQGGGTDTDSGLSGSIKGEPHKRISNQNPSGGISEGSCSPLGESPVENYAENLASKIEGSPTLLTGSPDIGVSLDGNPEESPDVFWNFGNNGPPLQFKIEEHIEEVTTHQLTDEEFRYSENEVETTECSFNGLRSELNSLNDGPARNKFKRRVYASKVSPKEQAEVLPTFDLPSISYEDISGSARVPFPELGVDLLQGSPESFDGGPSDLLLENIDWKQNWLFRRQKRKKNNGENMDTITMLIPNPSSNIGPTIGDKDVDELSELSDRHSNYSFDTSSDEEKDNVSSTKTQTLASKDLIELVGEINAEFAQQDHEYTEDFSSLVRREWSTGHSKYVGSIDQIEEELTGVTPVLKPRMKSNSSNLNSNQSQSSFQHKFPTTQEEFEQRTLSNYSTKCSSMKLSTPSTVPEFIDDSYTSSPSIWFESLLEDQMIPAGRALRLSCQIQARQIFEVSWYFEGNLLSDNKHTVTWKKGDSHHLNVFEMAPDKAGTFAIAAYTMNHCVWSRCQVFCSDQHRLNKIPKITLTLSDAIVEAGSELVLECQVGGHPEPKVTFIKNNTTLPPYSQSHYIENDQYGTWVLNMREVKERDGGQIKAIASNSLGHAMTCCTISVAPEGQIANYKVNQTQKLDNRTYKKKKKYYPAPSLTKPNTTEHIPKGGARINNIGNQRTNSSSSSSVNVSESSEYAAYPYSNINQERQNNFGVHTSEDSREYSDGITINGCLYQSPKPGTIAEREHRKWLEAKPLPNNPYAPEKLVDRLGRSPHRFPSLPTVYRDTSGDEGREANLRDGLMSSTSDLSRYSRDYHVSNKLNDNFRQRNNYDAKRSEESQFRAASESQFPAPPSECQFRVPSECQFRVPSECLVKIESKKSANWKEELKDIKLDVGKKVADIQKTIDACQHEWRLRMQQRGWNPPLRRPKLNQKHQKLSASCINLHTPPKNKAYSNYSSNRHLIYSSTENLNTAARREQHYQNNLWRTVSVDTLNTPSKYSFSSFNPSFSGERRRNCQRYESREAVDGNKDPQNQILSDSDESSGLNTSYYSINNKYTGDHYGHHNGYPSKKMTSYFSENSIDSLKEESDTEDSLSAVGDNLPSVKELASKFDSLKSSRKLASISKRSHEKSLKSFRNKDVLIVEQRDLTSPISSPLNHNGYNRKYNDKNVVNEVHHSLTARSVSRSFREGLRMQNHRKTQPLLEPLTDESSRNINHHQVPQTPLRDTSSPEHLGIPSSPASIPNRLHQYSYPPPGDTSDDSSVAITTPRKTFRKRTYNGSQMRGNFNSVNPI